MKLIIKESSWSGLNNECKPLEIEHKYEINKNEKIIVKTMQVSSMKDGNLITKEEEVLSFEISEINNNSIKIKTFQVFSDNNDGTINLNTDKKEFIIEKGKEQKLVTPSMDFGYIFVFNLVD